MYRLTHSAWARVRPWPVGGSIDCGWVDAFRWADGFFLGDVEAYTTVESTAAYPLSARGQGGGRFSNVFNDRHWKSFAGVLSSSAARSSACNTTGRDSAALPLATSARTRGDPVRASRSYDLGCP